MHQHTVEVGNVLIVDNKIPVRLKKRLEGSSSSQYGMVWMASKSCVVVWTITFFPCASTIMIEETGRTCTPCLVSIGTFISLE